MVARFVGARKMGQAGRVANQALLIGAAMAAVALLLGSLWSRQAVALLQLDGDAAEAAIRYIGFILPVLPLVMVETVGIACLRGAGDMITGLVVMGIVNAVNIAVSWSLVLGLGPMPELGWDGLAVGTVSGYVVGGLSVLGLLLRGRGRLKIRWRWLRPNGNLIRRLLWIGLPGGADMLSVIVCQFWFVAVINRLGDLAAAAHGVAIRIESLAFLPGVAFQVAATTLVGQYLGARNYRKASRSVWMTLAVGGSVMMGSGVLIFAAAPQLAGLFVGAEQAEVARLAVPLLRIVSVAIPALALTMILSGALRGAGDTRWPLAFTLVGFLVVRIPMAYWLAFDTVEIPLTGLVVSGWGLGVRGAWIAMAIDLAVRAVLVVYRFRHGGWKRIEV